MTTLMAAPGASIGLVVEDEWLLRMELVDELREAGFQTLEAATGDAALSLLDSDLEADFLVTDIRLPGAADGWAVAERFRDRHPGKPVIYVSANPDLAARRVDGSVFLGKPCDMRQLLETIAKLLK